MCQNILLSSLLYFHILTFSIFNKSNSGFIHFYLTKNIHALILDSAIPTSVSSKQGITIGACMRCIIQVIDTTQYTWTGCEEILEMTVVWHQGHLTRQGSGRSWLIATNCAGATEKTTLSTILSLIHQTVENSRSGWSKTLKKILSGNFWNFS